MKFKKIVSIAVAALFVGSLAALGIQNFDILKDEGKKLLSDSKSIEDVQKNAQNIEASLKKSFSMKSEAADVYGLSLNAFSNGIVGNYNFYKSSDGSTRCFYYAFDGQNNIESVNELNEYCNSQDIPLIYIKYPDIIVDKNEREFSGFCDFQHVVDGLYDSAANEGVNVIDLNKDEYLTEEQIKSYYYKTDGHGTMHSAFLTSKIICDELIKKYGITFPLYQQVFNEKNYEVKSYPFLGNFAKTGGIFFSGTEQFDLLFPTFETDMELVIYDNGTRKTGTFDAVCMNGFENKPGYYMITNYLQYPKASYKVYNYNVKGPKLLVIADSIMLTTASYLALTSSEVTMIDPRQGNNKYLVANALVSGDYDAVILAGISNQYFSSEFRSAISISEIEERGRVPKMGRYGVKIQYCDGKRQGSLDTITVDPEDNTFTLSGWAVDPGTEDELMEVYIQAGDKIIKCDYGLQSDEPYTYYQNDKLKNCGFRVSLSSEFIRNKNGTLYDSICMVCVSKDGTYKYAPIDFKLDYAK